VRFRKCNEQIPLAEMPRPLVPCCRARRTISHCLVKLLRLIGAVAVHLDVGRLSQARKAADTVRSLTTTPWGVSDSQQGLTSNN
jgi:hypothetical protein